VLVASFAVGRAQQLIYLLQVLIRSGRLPSMPVCLDSPMAVDATRIFRDHLAEHDLAEGMLDERDSVLAGPRVRLCRSVDESKRINGERGPAVIVSSSGMMTGGRILHHLRQRLPHAENTVLLGGYQAVGTRGRQLQDGARSLRIHGEDVPVRAAVDRITALSGHAGRSGLLRWLAPLSPRRCALVHGEPDAMDALAATLRADRGWDVRTPELGESIEL
jgi:metallo-beta-lactamase family protein